jgi:lysozyme family protein
MAVITQQYIDAIHRYEGGETGDPKDPASKDPSPCGFDKHGNKIHTNKGVTYSTFKLLAEQLGYTADCHTFLAMPDDVWIKIFKHGYWNPIQLDNINSNGVAYLLADFSWGSGVSYVPTFLQKFLSNNYNISASDTITQNKALNNLTANTKKESDVINKLSAARLESLKSMKDGKLFATYGNGWTDRLNGLTSLAHGMAGKAKNEVKDVLKDNLPASAYGSVASAYHFTRRNNISVGLTVLGATGVVFCLIKYRKELGLIKSAA